MIKHAQKFLFWFGVLAVSLLVMVKPAHALQTAPPSNPPAYTCVGWSGGSASTVAGLTALIVSRYGSLYKVAVYPANGTPNTIYSTGGYGCFAGNTAPVPPNGFQYSIQMSYPGGTPNCSGLAGSTFNPATGLCEKPDPVCPAAGTVVSSGTFDLGTDYDRPQAGILSGCGANNCETRAASIDPVSSRGKVAGVYHYYAQGVIVFSGASCVAGTPTTASTVNVSTLQQSCAVGEVGIMSTGGVLNCYKDGAIQSASAPAATTTSTATSTTTTTDQATGASSVSATTTQTTTQTIGGSGNIAGVPSDLQGYCARNPSADICKQGQPSSTVGTAALSGLYTKGTRTISNAFTDFKTTVQAAPIITASSGFFNITLSAASCQTWSYQVPMVGTITFDHFCRAPFTDYLPALRAIVLIVFTVAAFRIAIL